MLSARTIPRQPLFLGALAFGGGIVIANAHWRPPLWWLVGALACSLASIVFLYTRRFGGRFALVTALAAIFACGAFSLAAKDAGVKSAPDLSPYLSGEEVVVTAHVIHDGVLRGVGPVKRQSLDVESEDLTLDGVTVPLVTGIRVNIFSRNAEVEMLEGALPPVLTYGQRLRFPIKLRTPRNFQNPGEWDYRGYLAQQGICALGSVANDRLERLEGFYGSRHALWGSRARRSVLEHVHALWPPAQAGLLDAALIGERSFIDRDTSVNWQRTGIYHILVVSGMNLAILAGAIFWTLRRLRASEVLSTAVTIAISFAYAYLAEAGSPVMRSALMVALYLCARLLYRDRASLNVIGGAALGILALNPRSIFEASFQMTFLAVVIIAGVCVPLLEGTITPLRQALVNLNLLAYDLSLPPRLVQLRLDLRLLSGLVAALLPGWPVKNDDLRSRIATALVRRVFGSALLVCELLLISLLMQIALVAPMAHYFHRATVVGLPANMLAVPLTGILMPAAAAAVALSYVWLPLAKIPAIITALALEGITGTVGVLGGMRIADVRVPSPSQLSLLAAAAALALAILLARRRPLVSAVGLAALVASSLWIALAPPAPQIRPGLLEITSIDVGQADSTLLVTPQGRTLLVDAAGSFGPFQSEFDFGEQVVSPYLWGRAISRLDAVALTHAHSDHYGGMRAVIANFRPRELWLGPIPETRPIQELLATAAAHHVRVVRRAAGDQFEFGGAEVAVLAPPFDWPISAQPRNNDSMVLRLNYGSTAAILAADAEKFEETYLVETYGRGDRMPITIPNRNDALPRSLSLRADVLRVAHNGSRTSTRPEFLAAVRPSVALISVGAHNSFGHPRREVLSRLGEMKVRTYRTDMMGGITCYLDGSTVQVTPTPR